ncbi:hypothetical protein TNCV_3172491 [Trichonephila clavipes]|nr:hypothetical protein TNCV_3172491 [Trichonephila clavipes]
MALLDEWCNIPQDLIDNLILSMARHCKAYQVHPVCSNENGNIQEDNVPCYTAVIFHRWFEEHNMDLKLFSFNLQSPDLYPIENLVEEIEQSIQLLGPKLSNLKAMENNLVALHFKYDQARRRFVEWAQNEIAVVPDFHKRILFSDEVHFWLNGYVNKQDSRIWSEANPQVYVETPLHPEKLTVWCALWAGGILLQKR